MDHLTKTFSEELLSLNPDEETWWELKCDRCLGITLLYAWLVLFFVRLKAPCLLVVVEAGHEVEGELLQVIPHIVDPKDEVVNDDLASCDVLSHLLVTSVILFGHEHDVVSVDVVKGEDFLV